MPRPQKPRNICHMPKYLVFGPKGHRANNAAKITMMLDELETIRLIDYLGYNQEEAALQMNVARTTVQRIYNDARKKLSDSLIEGKMIVIEGGDFKLCENDCVECIEPLRMRQRRGNRRD